MNTYERVKFYDKSTGRRRRARTVILRDPTIIPFIGTKALTGIEVNRYGDEVAPNGADERLRIIVLDLIEKRVPLCWNLHYGDLEERDS